MHYCIPLASPLYLVKVWTLMGIAANHAFHARQPLHDDPMRVLPLHMAYCIYSKARLLAAGLDIDGIAEDYVFKPHNPFMADMHSFAKAKSLFRHGILSEAVYALEAEVQRKPNNVEAWRLLGTVHAENDDDSQAISAMARALKADPTNAEVGWVGLSVCMHVVCLACSVLACLLVCLPDCLFIRQIA